MYKIMKFTINYYLKDGRQKLSLVIIACRWNGHSVKVSTQQNVYTIAYDKVKQRCFTSPEKFPDRVNRQSRKVNKILDVLELRIASYFEDHTPKSTKSMTEEEFVKTRIQSEVTNLTGVCSKKMKKEEISPKDEKQELTPIEFFESYIEQKRVDPHTGRYISDRTKSHQRTVIQRLKKFLDDTNLPNKFETFCSQKFDAQYTEWCYSIKNYKQNTVYATYGVLKPLLNAAKLEGVVVGEHYKHLKGKCTDVDSVYLTEDEIKKIYHLDIPKLIEQGEIDGKSRMEQTRDLFIISCWTALRRSDINNLQRASFDLEKRTITVTAEKTKRQIVIPMHPYVFELWNKYGGCFPRLGDASHTNIHLRECARLAGIDDEVRIVENRGGKVKTLIYKKYQLLGIHSGRRSFATNMYKRKFPTIAIMKLTGHTTEANFLKYIKITPEENAVMLAEEFYKAKKPFDGDFSTGQDAEKKT